MNPISFQIRLASQYEIVKYFKCLSSSLLRFPIYFERKFLVLDALELLSGVELGYFSIRYFEIHNGSLEFDKGFNFSFSLETYFWSLKRLSQFIV